MTEDITLFQKNGARLFLDADERQRLASVCKYTDDSLAATYALILLNTGCRLSEATALHSGSIDIEEMHVTFKTLKRNKTHFRTVPLSPSLLHQLVEVHTLSRQGKNQARTLWKYSRTTAWRRVKSLLDDAGIRGPQAAPKGLRHGFGIACVEQHIPITVVQKWLGHASPTTTASYLKVMGIEERLLANRVWSLAD